MRRSALVIILASLSLAVVAGPATARATATPFAATETTTSQGAPDALWVSGRILHIRGEVDTGTLAGDLVGTITTVIDGNVNLDTGDGTTHGTFVITTATETWSGTFRGTISPDGVNGRFDGQGLNGTKIFGSFTTIAPGVFIDSGVVLDPQG
jgi:hypothetical protein